MHSESDGIAGPAPLLSDMFSREPERLIGPHLVLWLALLAGPTWACSTKDPSSTFGVGGETGALGAGGSALPSGGTSAAGGTGFGGAANGGAANGGAANGGAANGGGPTGSASSFGGGSGAFGGAAGNSASSGGSSSGGSSGGLAGSAGRSASGGSAALGEGGSSDRGGARNSGGSAGQPVSSGGQAQGGSGGGSNAYKPCPTNGSSCIVLPFGDSITDGIGSTDQAGYRSPLFKLVVQANQKMTFVGSRSSGPAQVAGKTFPKSHEGHPGWTIDPKFVTYGDGISTLIPSPAFTTIPHVVLLMIGTNDVNSTMGLTSIADRLDTLLDKIIQVAPDALIVVAAPTPLKSGSSALTTYISKIPGIAKQRAGRGQHIVAVDMSKLPLSNLSSDGIHPNDQGYVYMADIWYAAIKDLLPQ